MLLRNLKLRTQVPNIQNTYAALFILLTIALNTSSCSKEIPDNENPLAKNLQYIFILKSKSATESKEANGITCYNPDFSKRWEISNLSAFNNYAIYAYKNTLVFQVNSSGSKYLYAVDIDNGITKWKNETTGNYSGFTVKNDTIFAGITEDNPAIYKIKAFNLSTGNLLFEHAVPAIGTAPRTLTAIDNYLYCNYYDAATRDEGIAAYDYVDKQIRWRTFAGIHSSDNYFISHILPYKHLLLFRTGTRFITAVDRNTGKIEWSRLAYEPTNLQLVDDKIRVMHRFASFGVSRYFELNPLNGEPLLQKGEYTNHHVPGAHVGKDFGYYSDSKNIYKFKLQTGENSLVGSVTNNFELVYNLQGSENKLIVCKAIPNAGSKAYRLLSVDRKSENIKDSLDIKSITFFNYFLHTQ